MLSWQNRLNLPVVYTHSIFQPRANASCLVCYFVWVLANITSKCSVFAAGEPRILTPHHFAKSLVPKSQSRISNLANGVTIDVDDDRAFFQSGLRRSAAAEHSADAAFAVAFL